MDCATCNIEISDHIDYFWNCDDEPVCDECAKLVPVFSVNFVTARQEFYGTAEFKGCEIGCAWTQDRRIAKKEIIEMCRKLWGAEIKPVEECD